MSEFSLIEAIKYWDRISKVEFCIFCYEKVHWSMNDMDDDVIKSVKRWVDGEENVKELKKISNDTSFNNLIYGTVMSVCAWTNVEYFTDIAATHAAEILLTSVEKLYLQYCNR